MRARKRELDRQEELPWLGMIFVPFAAPLLIQTMR